MDSGSERSVRLSRTSLGRYTAENVRGGRLSIGSGDDDDFTPVELLLAAIAACSAIDVDLIVSKRAEPEAFEMTMTGDKVRDDSGNRLTNLEMTYQVTFPADEQGEKALSVLPRSVQQSHDRLCTVSRTVELGTPVTVRIAGE